MPKQEPYSKITDKKAGGGGGQHTNGLRFQAHFLKFKKIMPISMFSMKGLCGTHIVLAYVITSILVKKKIIKRLNNYLKIN